VDQEPDRVIILPCSQKGVNISCYHDCEKGKWGNPEKIELCYTLLKKSKIARKGKRNVKDG